LAIWIVSGSPEFAKPHPVDTIGEHDLDMFAVADITAEGAGASLPVHHIIGFPIRRCVRRGLSGAARVSLARLARLTAR
jgi:hypothetical protein